MADRNMDFAPSLDTHTGNGGKGNCPESGAQQSDPQTTDQQKIHQDFLNSKRSSKITKTCEQGRGEFPEFLVSVLPASITNGPPGAARLGFNSEDNTVISKDKIVNNLCDSIDRDSSNDEVNFIDKKFVATTTGIQQNNLPMRNVDESANDVYLSLEIENESLTINGGSGFAAEQGDFVTEARHSVQFDSVPAVSIEESPCLASITNSVIEEVSNVVAQVVASENLKEQPCEEAPTISQVADKALTRVAIIPKHLANLLSQDTGPRRESAVVREAIHKAMHSDLMTQSVRSMILENPTEESISNKLSAEMDQEIANLKDKGLQDATQALKLIFKLHSYAQELEQGLLTAGERQASEQRTLEDQLLRKSKQLDNMRIRCQRTEYAIKEGMVFLGNPLREYAQILESAPNVRINYGSPSQIADATFNGTKPPASTPIIESPISDTTRLTPFEIRSTETIRLTYLYLKNVHEVMEKAKIIGDEIPEIPRLVSPHAMPQDVDNESIVFLKASTVLTTRPSGDSSAPSSIHTSQLQLSSTANLSGATPTAKKATSTPSRERFRNIVYANHPLDGEGDDITENSSAKNSGGSSKRCETCRTLMLQVDSKNDEIRDLNKKIANLDKSLDDGKNLVEKIKLEKSLVEEQLEDLTGELFEQANLLVADEARLRDGLERAKGIVENQVLEWKRRCERREEDLRLKIDELDLARRRLLQLEKVPEIDEAPYISACTVALYVKSYDTGLARKVDSGQLPIIPVLYVDAQLYNEFQEHIQQTIKDTVVNPISTNSTTFMKRCLVEDVEPCLYYCLPDTQSKGLFSNASALPAAAKKRLSDAVSRGGCELQSVVQRKGEGAIHTRSASAVASTSLVPPKAKCSVCTLHRECEFRMRFSSPPSEWSPICRFCRDRVLSACEFYNFLHSLRSKHNAGQSSQSMLGMFRHAMWLRRRMANARISNCGLFDGEPASRLVQGPKCPIVVGSEGPAGGDWETWCFLIC